MDSSVVPLTTLRRGGGTLAAEEEEVIEVLDSRSLSETVWAERAGNKGTFHFVGRRSADCSATKTRSARESAYRGHRWRTFLEPATDPTRRQTVRQTPETGDACTLGGAGAEFTKREGNVNEARELARAAAITAPNTCHLVKTPADRISRGLVLLLVLALVLLANVRRHGGGWFEPRAKARESATLHRGGLCLWSGEPERAEGG